jgi:4-carboxymuconolactone decarboxylase
MNDIKPRILPLPRAEWTDDAREVFAMWGEPNAWEEGSKTNVIMVLANHPAMAHDFSVWSKHLLMSNTLSTRFQELVILRVAWRVKSAYEWHNHVGYGLNAGLTLEEIAGVRDFPAGNWNEQDAIVLASVDELIDNGNLSDATWDTLGKYFDKRQKMDLVLSIGHYVMTSWALAVFGVEIEGGADQIGFDMKTKSGRIPGKTYKPGETEDWIETRGY